jgi:hypothetical protein
VTFISGVFFRTLVLTGNSNMASNAAVLNSVKDDCRETGVSYVEGSLKYCNCDRCNGEDFKCETSGPK